jgi:hypothetical protein
MTAADLSVETSYGKRNVLNELEPLRFAGVVKSFRAVNADRFSLAKVEQIQALVSPLPQRYTRWTQVLGALHAIHEVARRGVKRSDLQSAVEAVRLLEERKQVFCCCGGRSAAFASWTRCLARVPPLGGGLRQGDSPRVDPVSSHRESWVARSSSALLKGP